MATALAAIGSPLLAEERRYVVAFANVTDEPGVTLESTGFSAREVRESFVLAARSYPIDLVFYDNGRDCKRAPANAEDAVARKVDLFVQYCHHAPANAMIGEKLKTARIRVLAVNEAIADAPLYTLDNLAAGRLAGDALGAFATRTWRNQPVEAVIIGPLTARGVPERAHGAQEQMLRHVAGARVTRLDTQGNVGQVSPLLGTLLAARASSKILVAAMDDATALAAKSALESLGRASDAAIVGQGLDRSIHGGMSDRKEIDPANRGSIVLGSVAFYLDRYGYEILPLAMKMLRGEPVPARTVTAHRLVTAANVFLEYPPSDMQ
jgi:hypothetical protein